MNFLKGEKFYFYKNILIIRCNKKGIYNLILNYLQRISIFFKNNYYKINLINNYLLYFNFVFDFIYVSININIYYCLVITQYYYISLN